MPVIREPAKMPPKVKRQKATLCFHCGVECLTDRIVVDEKHFCCDGCKLVYELINDNGLCDYYQLQSHPGLSQVKPVGNEKYTFLDDNDIAARLYKFTNGDQAIVTLYIPSIHCASCMWLLEHMGRLNEGISESRLNFSTKEVTIHFSLKRISLRKVVELLCAIGYEPYISLEDSDGKASGTYNRERLIKLGVAGFCFGNIMMMSFPEYLSGVAGIEAQYAHLFRYLNLLLSLPVFFYCASEFFITSWNGIQQKMLNIDAPIALALLIAFGRSVYEIGSNTGAGYLDSMSGIVFFMLVGRVVQERTWRSLSFTRDYKSYFPIAVNVTTPDGIISKQLKDLREKDVVVLHHGEIVPADSQALNDAARIDYSFVTGESEPVTIKRNELVYAGGRQLGEELIVQVVKPIAASYLTSLWNHYAFRNNKTENNDRKSTIHVLSQYFTVVLFSLALVTGIYWYLHDSSKIVNSVSAMLIVACPCALLLSATFTNGNILRIFSNNGFYLRDSTVIEQLAEMDHIVFDKTGTITQSGSGSILTSGDELTEAEKDILFSVVRNSNHPGSKALKEWLGERTIVQLRDWTECAGGGVKASAGFTEIAVGSATFAGVEAKEDKATVYVRINDKVCSVHLDPVFREHMPGLVRKLKKQYAISLLSGDNDKQEPSLRKFFGAKSELLFGQKPMDKLFYIESLQQQGRKVMMMGDGLNDAGALQQSNVGITLADDVNNFTPACDAILDVKQAALFPAIITLAKYSKKVIRMSFIVSIVYNIAGLYFATQGLLKPVAAAILMPCSTLSIVIISSGLSSILAWRRGLV